MTREDRDLVQTDDEGSDYNSSSLMAGRAISCSDLLLDIERPKVSVGGRALSSYTSFTRNTFHQ